MESAGIDRLQIERACERLSIAFCYHADHGNFAKVGRLFSPKGTFDRFGQTLVGPDAIAAGMSKRPEGVVTRHALLNIHFTVVEKGMAAAVVSAATYFGFKTSQGDAAQFAPESPRVAEFDDRYRLVEGKWRIEQRVTTLVLVNSS